MADQVLGRPIQVGNQVRVCGYVQQEPVLTAEIKSIDVFVVWAAA